MLIDPGTLKVGSDEPRPGRDPENRVERAQRTDEHLVRGVTVLSWPEMIVPATYSGICASGHDLAARVQELEINAKESDVPVVEHQRDLRLAWRTGHGRRNLEPVLGADLLQRHGAGQAPPIPLWTEEEPSCLFHMSPARAGLGGSVTFGFNPVTSAPRVWSSFTAARDPRHHLAGKAQDGRMEDRDVLDPAGMGALEVLEGLPRVVERWGQGSPADGIGLSRGFLRSGWPVLWPLEDAHEAPEVPGRC